MTQRRQDGSVDLNRTWLVYEVGFRMLSSEFVLVQVKGPSFPHWSRWLGNENGCNISEWYKHNPLI